MVPSIGAVAETFDLRNQAQVSKVDLCFILLFRDFKTDFCAILFTFVFKKTQATVCYKPNDFLARDHRGALVIQVCNRQTKLWQEVYQSNRQYACWIFAESKIESAKKSFESSRQTINEVMYEVGYSDVKAFREVFKKLPGCRHWNIGVNTIRRRRFCRVDGARAAKTYKAFEDLIGLSARFDDPIFGWSKKKPRALLRILFTP